jgi:transposase
MIVEPPASIDTPERLFTKLVSRTEIVVGLVTIRLEEGASAARLAAIARALAATP